MSMDGLDMINELDIELAKKVANTLKENPELRPIVTRARSIWKGGYKVESDVKDFKVIVDEPCGVGGTDEGPNPMAMLLGALGSCFSIVYVFVATMEGVEIEKLEVEMEGDIDIPAFLAMDDSLKPEEMPGFTSIRSRVYVKSKAPLGQLEKICHKAAKFSPVGQSLRQPVKVETIFSSRRLA